MNTRPNIQYAEKCLNDVDRIIGNIIKQVPPSQEDGKLKYEGNELLLAIKFLNYVCDELAIDTTLDENDKNDIEDIFDERKIQYERIKKIAADINKINHNSQIHHLFLLITIALITVKIENSIIPIPKITIDMNKAAATQCSFSTAVLNNSQSKQILSAPPLHYQLLAQKPLDFIKLDTQLEKEQRSLTM